MTNNDLKKKYGAIFSFHFLYNDTTGKTLLAGTNNRPAPGGSCFAYCPKADDFIKVHQQNIVAEIRIKSYKSQA